MKLNIQNIFLFLICFLTSSSFSSLLTKEEEEPIEISKEKFEMLKGNKFVNQTYSLSETNIIKGGIYFIITSDKQPSSFKVISTDEDLFEDNENQYKVDFLKGLVGSIQFRIEVNSDSDFTLNFIVKDYNLRQVNTYNSITTYNLYKTTDNKYSIIFADFKSSFDYKLEIKKEKSAGQKISFVNFDASLQFQTTFNSENRISFTYSKSKSIQEVTVIENGLTTSIDYLIKPVFYNIEIKLGNSIEGFSLFNEFNFRISFEKGENNFGMTLIKEDSVTSAYAMLAGKNDVYKYPEENDDNVYKFNKKNFYITDKVIFTQLKPSQASERTKITLGTMRISELKVNFNVIELTNSLQKYSYVFLLDQTIDNNYPLKLMFFHKYGKDIGYFKYSISSDEAQLNGKTELNSIISLISDKKKYVFFDIELNKIGNVAPTLYFTLSQINKNDFFPLNIKKESQFSTSKPETQFLFINDNFQNFNLEIESKNLVNIVIFGSDGFTKQSQSIDKYIRLPIIKSDFDYFPIVIRLSKETTSPDEFTYKYVFSLFLVEVSQFEFDNIKTESFRQGTKITYKILYKQFSGDMRRIFKTIPSSNPSNVNIYGLTYDNTKTNKTEVEQIETNRIKNNKGIYTIKLNSNVLLFTFVFLNEDSMTSTLYNYTKSFEVESLNNKFTIKKNEINSYIYVFSFKMMDDFTLYNLFPYQTEYDYDNPPQLDYKYETMKSDDKVELQPPSSLIQLLLNENEFYFFLYIEGDIENESIDMFVYIKRKKEKEENMFLYNDILDKSVDISIENNRVLYFDSNSYDQTRGVFNFFSKQVKSIQYINNFLLSKEYDLVDDLLIIEFDNNPYPDYIIFNLKEDEDSFLNEEQVFNYTLLYKNKYPEFDFSENIFKIKTIIKNETLYYKLRFLSTSPSDKVLNAIKNDQKAYYKVTNNNDEDYPNTESSIIKEGIEVYFNSTINTLLVTVYLNNNTNREVDLTIHELIYKDEMTDRLSVSSNDKKNYKLNITNANNPNAKLYFSFDSPNMNATIKCSNINECKSNKENSIISLTQLEKEVPIEFELSFSSKAKSPLNTYRYQAVSDDYSDIKNNTQSKSIQKKTSLVGNQNQAFFTLDGNLIKRTNFILQIYSQEATGLYIVADNLTLVESSFDLTSKYGEIQVRPSLKVPQIIVLENKFSKEEGEINMKYTIKDLNIEYYSTNNDSITIYTVNPHEEILIQYDNSVKMMKDKIFIGYDKGINVDSAYAKVVDTANRKDFTFEESHKFPSNKWEKQVNLTGKEGEFVNLKVVLSSFTREDINFYIGKSREDDDHDDNDDKSGSGLSWMWIGVIIGGCVVVVGVIGVVVGCYCCKRGFRKRGLLIG